MSTALGDLVVRFAGDNRPLGRSIVDSKGMLGSLAKTAMQYAAPIAGALGAAESVNAARESIAAGNKLDAVLRATGGAAGLTGREIRTLADDLQRLTNFEGDATVAAAGVLATFKEIKGDVFKEALVAAQDMSAVMGQDLQSSVVQLGKALNDPVKGITALTRVGVSFTEQQKSQIKSLQESGDILGAQQVILRELKSEFGGAAEAMADPVTQAGNAIGDFAENLGALLLPTVNGLSEALADMLGRLGSDQWQEIGESIADVVVPAFEALFAILGKVAELTGLVIRGMRELTDGGSALLDLVGIDMSFRDQTDFSGPQLTSPTVPYDPRNPFGDAPTGEAPFDPYAFNRMLQEMAEAQEVRRGIRSTSRTTAAGRIGGGALSGLGDQAFEDTARRARETLAELELDLGEALGELTKAERDVIEFAESGATAEQVERYRELREAIEDAREAAKKLEEQEKRAAQIIEQFRTPLQEVRDDMQELTELREADLIDEGTFANAAADALRRFRDKQPQAAEIEPTEAVEVGTKEAFAAILKATGGAGFDPQREQLKKLDEQIEELESLGRSFQVMNNYLRNQPKPKIVRFNG